MGAEKSCEQTQEISKEKETSGGAAAALSRSSRRRRPTQLSSISPLRAGSRLQLHRARNPRYRSTDALEPSRRFAPTPTGLRRAAAGAGLPRGRRRRAAFRAPLPLPFSRGTLTPRAAAAPAPTAAGGEPAAAALATSRGGGTTGTGHGHGPARAARQRLLSAHPPRRVVSGPAPGSAAHVRPARAPPGGRPVAAAVRRGRGVRASECPVEPARRAAAAEGAFRYNRARSRDASLGSGGSCRAAALRRAGRRFRRRLLRAGAGRSEGERVPPSAPGSAAARPPPQAAAAPSRPRAREGPLGPGGPLCRRAGARTAAGVTGPRCQGERCRSGGAGRPRPGTGRLRLVAVTLRCRCRRGAGAGGRRRSRENREVRGRPQRGHVREAGNVLQDRVYLLL